MANEIRTAIEELIGETLAFANVAPEADRPGLMALCHSVMKECIGLQQLCTGSNVTHDDKRMKSQCLQNALFQLEMLANHSILRTFYNVFSDLKRNPVKSLRALSNTDSTEMEIDKFDDFLDSILHIGSFAVAHSINVKGKFKFVYFIRFSDDKLLFSFLRLCSKIEFTEQPGIVRSTQFILSAVHSFAKRRIGFEIVGAALE